MPAKSKTRSRGNIIAPVIQETAPRFVERDFEYSKEERRTWDPQWLECSDYILPRTSRFLRSGGEAGSVEDDNYGGKINSKIINGIAGHAVNTLSSGIMSGITNPSRRWFALDMFESQRKATKEEKIWISQLEKFIRDAFHDSNLYKLLPRVYEDLAIYGTSALGMFDGEGTHFRFEHYPVGSYWLRQDKYYKPNRFHRIQLKTLEQLIEEFCLDLSGNLDKGKFSLLTEEAQEAYRRREYNRKFEILESVMPMERRRFIGPETLTLKYQAREGQGEFKYIRTVQQRDTGHSEGDRDQLRFLHKGGFHEFPILVPRWHLNTPDVYGRSPGMYALGDIKQLQGMMRVKAIALKKQVSPPTMANSSLGNTRVSTDANAITFVGPSGSGAPEGLKPVYQVDPRLDHFTADILETQNRINLFFYTDLFLALSNLQRGDITATQIRAMQDEKFLQMGPLMTTLNEDFLEPMVALGRMKAAEVSLSRPEIMPPHPSSLEDMPVKARYISMVAMAMMGQTVEDLDRFESRVNQIAEVQRALGQEDTVDDLLDRMKLARQYAHHLGVDPSLLRSERDIKRMREDRNQMKMEAAQGQMAQEQAAQGQTNPETMDRAVQVAEALASQEGPQ